MMTPAACELTNRMLRAMVSVGGMPARDGVDDIFDAIFLGGRYWLHVVSGIFIFIIDGLWRLGSGDAEDH